MTVVFVPVRHHSPACARLVQRLVAERRPSRILIEGPSDFDAHDELLLPHRLPIAIYSYVRKEGVRSGAYYPFCVYSPEWQAIRGAGDAKIPFEFIDLPWSAMVDLDPAGAVRYADGAMRRSRMIDALCARLGVDDFDAAWDTLFEIPTESDDEKLLERLTLFCSALRAADEEAGAVRESDLVREAYMRSRIARAVAETNETDGPIVVVTGGYHTAALAPREELAFAMPARSEQAVTDIGIALTPYSFERLDAHTGYASGMPSPGFYQALWDGIAPMTLAMTAMRDKKQSVSTADLITADTIAAGLASFRGHERVFRSDVLDGARAALVKDTIEGDSHPVMAALLAAFRGGERGRLADGTRRPPLAIEVTETLESAGLWPAPFARTVDLRLRNTEERHHSRLLHRAVALGLRGFRRIGGTDFTTRTDLADPSERWEIVWTPELEGDCIESALYGGTWIEAVTARFAERAAHAQRDAAEVAQICLDATRCGLDALTQSLAAQLTAVIRDESEFARLTVALGHLLYLYRFDDTLGSAGGALYLDLLAEAYERGIWLLATLGDGSPPVLDGVARMLDARRRCPERLVIEPLRDVLHIAAHDRARAPSLRGAAAGGLFAIGDAEGLAIADLVQAFARPEQLGDFLTGLFTVAREAVKSEPRLMLRLDELLLAFSDDDYLAALPALRLAFSFFPPREKHQLVRRMLEALGDHSAPLPALAVSAGTAAAALSLESRLVAALDRHGIRPLPPVATREAKH